jgi:hypothetical protein
MGVEVTTGQKLKMYMDDMGWSVIDLHRLTLISIKDLKDILSDKNNHTMDQLMIIVNKINLKQPKQNHWTINQNKVQITHKGRNHGE